MNDQGGSFEVLRIGHRVVALHALDVLPWSASQDFGCETVAGEVTPILGVEIVHAGMVHNALEAIGVAEYPRRHISAVTGAGGRETVTVDAGEFLQQAVLCCA